MNSFNSFPLNAGLLKVISELGFTNPTPIQTQAIPVILDGKDLRGESQTGSGKTLAFSIPIIDKIKIELKEVQALVLCPTRELATQVVKEMRKIGRYHDGLHVLCITGGQSGRDQRIALENGAHIVVGTPGRILDLISRDQLNLNEIKTLVFDEADKMFEMGFEEDIAQIMKEVPPKRQTLFFSATFPESVLGWSQRYQKNPHFLKIQGTPENKPQIHQHVYISHDESRVQTLMRVLQQHPSDSTLIFCNQKITVNEIYDLLREQGVHCVCLHGDLEQKERECAMALFRNRSARIMIATDVAARGLDINDLQLIINFDFPRQVETYVHRIGRTGRAGQEGTAVLIGNHKETFNISELETALKINFERPQLGFKNQYGLSFALKKVEIETLVIYGGRKDKLRPGDIMGALTGEGSKFSPSEVGKIEIYDHITYVAIGVKSVKLALEKLRLGKIKGKKYQAKIYNF
jgi:ATP-independent RNA helicase DbpA